MKRQHGLFAAGEWRITMGSWNRNGAATSFTLPSLFDHKSLTTTPHNTPPYSNCNKSVVRKQHFGDAVDLSLAITQRELETK
jgi:hypothetical protein